MNRHHAPMRTLRAPHRFAAAFAAVTVTLSIFSGVLLSFQPASLDIWLAPTPEVMAMVADCDRQPDRQMRDRCKQQLVTARLALERRALHLARR